MRKRVAVVDYGLGNVASVLGGIKRLGHEAILTRKEADLFQSDRIILPGVGAFGDGMQNLKEFDLIEPIRQCSLDKMIPLLGICLGMQLLATKSYEHGEHKGLGLIDGKVVALKEGSENTRKIHIGWNDIEIDVRQNLFYDLEKPVVFFVHGFHLVPEDSTCAIAWSEYGQRFVAAVRKENIFGVQFHPEKSQKDGLAILKNFIENDPC